MGMNPVLLGVIIYLLLGVVLLGIFDVLTKRIRSKFVQSTSETQQRLIASGSFVGTKSSACLFIGAMWLFWPLVFVGALTGELTGEKEGNSGSQK